MSWKMAAIAGWVVILLAAAALAGALIYSKARFTATVSPTPTPSVETSPEVVSSPQPEPSPSPPPAPAHFVIMSTSWQNCNHAGQTQLVPPYCDGHGVFLNDGGTAGSVPVTFAIPGVAQCTTVVPLTLPGSAKEASCDLGIAGLNWYNVNGNVNGGPPSTTVANP
jgi:hypothetical protein